MNYYELLGVSKTATEEEIKSAYKNQMKKWHPDINKSEESINMSSKINEAKEVLLDSVKRKDYDEYLDSKSEENYNRYTQRKHQQKTSNNVYEAKKVTKWEYLKEWIKHANVKPIKKIMAVIGVLLESALCFIIKMILIGFARLCNYVSYFIKVLFYYLAPIIGLITVVVLINIILNGFINTKESMGETLNVLIISLIVFLSSLFLPLLSKLVLSPKVFNILYNKIDVVLFKKCVGYTD